MTSATHSAFGRLHSASTPAVGKLVRSAPTAHRFSRPRFAVLVLAGVYPLITGLLYLLLPMLQGWAIWQETLVIAPLMVAMMVWGVIPAIQRRFNRFINPLAG